MTSSRILFAFIALAATPGFAQQAASQTATAKPGIVEGVVVNQITGEPVRRAEVRLIRSVRPGASGPQSIVPGAGGGAPMVTGGMIAGGAGMAGRSGVTDQNGVFRIANVEPGEYRVMAQRQGFVAAIRSGAARQNDDAVTVAEGETVSGLRLTLLPQAVLAGRVVDEEGEPVQGVMIGATPRSASTGAAGRRGFQGVRGVMTNDLGEFRLTGIAPGKVLLTIQPRTLMGGAEPADPSAGGQPMGYVPMYYPGVTDPAQAQVLDAKPGAEITNLDIHLRRMPVFKVSGRAFDADGAPLRRFMVMANAVGQPQQMPVGVSSGARDDGSFEIANLPGGDYTIVVRPMGRGPAGPGGPMVAGGPGGAQSVGVTRVSIANRNIEGLVVQAQPGFDVKGAVQVETSGDKPVLSGMRVSLVSGDNLFMMGARPGPVQPDNSFTLAGLMPGKYRLATSTPAAGLYLASVRVGEQEMFGRELDFSNGPTGSITLTFRTDGGKISGMIDPSEIKGLAAAPTAVLVPADESLRDAIPARTAKVSDAGTFEWADLRPGEYLVWVFDNYDSNEIADPDFLKPVENRAVKLRISASQSASASTKLTPWPSSY